MKKLLLGLLLLAGMNVHAVNLPQASSVAQGGGSPTTNAPSGLICPLANLANCGATMICGGGTPSVSFNYFGLYSQNAPGSLTQYQVPSGKVFYSIQMWYFDTTAGDIVQFGYGTAPLASDNTSSSPTGSVQYNTGSTSAWVAATSNGVTTYSAVGLNWPALSYPYLRGNGTTANHDVCILGVVK